MLKEHRHVADDHEIASSYTAERIREVYTPRQKFRRNKKAGENETAERFLGKINETYDTNYALSEKPLPENSPVDCVAVDAKTSRSLLLQVRTSDDEPIKDLMQGKIVHRSGKRHEIHHGTIKRAILSKSTKYPAAVKKGLTLLLDGWLGVTEEDLEEFVAGEQTMLRGTGFKEIWFVGSDLIKRLV
jgi:hypothetical protein